MKIQGDARSVPVQPVLRVRVFQGHKYSNTRPYPSPARDFCPRGHATRYNPYLWRIYQLADVTLKRNMKYVAVLAKFTTRHAIQSFNFYIYCSRLPTINGPKKPTLNQCSQKPLRCVEVRSFKSPKVKAPLMAICASAQQLNEWYHILTSYFEK